MGAFTLVSALQNQVKMKIVAFFIAFLTATGIYAQNSFPFTWKKNTDIAIGSVSIGLNLCGTIASSRLAPFDEAALAGLQKFNILPVFDRIAVRPRSEKNALMSDIIARGSVALPLVFAFTKPTRQKDNILLLGGMYAETLSMTLGITNLTKNLVHRTRPFVYAPLSPVELRLGKDARRSFFSGHTASTAASAFFAATVFDAVYPHSKLKPWIWGTAFALPALAGWSRVRSGNHFPTDVLVGYGVGALCGWLVPKWHRVK